MCSAALVPSWNLTEIITIRENCTLILGKYLFNVPPKIMVTHEKIFSAVVLGAIFPKPMDVRLVKEKYSEDM